MAFVASNHGLASDLAGIHVPASQIRMQRAFEIAPGVNILLVPEKFGFRHRDVDQPVTLTNRRYRP